LVEVAALGEKGRNVRCAKCKHVWFAEPVPDAAPGPTPESQPSTPEPQPAPEAEPRPIQPHAASPGRGARSDADAPPVRPAAAPARHRAPERDRARQRRSGAAGWALLFLIVVGVLTGGYAARDDIVRLWPPAERLYVMLKIPLQPINRIGLELHNLKFEKTVADGVPVVTVSGEVISISGETRTVPPIRIALHDSQAKEIYSWTTTAEAGSVAARGVTTFSTSLENPPEDARGLSVTFVTSPGGN